MGIKFHNVIAGVYQPGDHTGADLGQAPGSVTTPATPSAAPGNTSVLLDWADSPDTGFDHFVIKQATVNGGPYTEIATSPTSVFAVTGLTNGTAYYFVITAVNDLGEESSNSTQVNATPAAGGDTTAPAAPTTLAATAGAGQITLNWDDNAEGDLNHYRVYRGTVTGGPYTFVAIAPDSSYINTGLTNGTEYFFKVSAVDDSNNESAKSNEDSETPLGTGNDVTAPATPTGLAIVSAGSAGSITLNWNDNGESDFSYYKVWRAPTSGGTFAVIATPSASTYIDTNVTGGEDYFYKVSALDLTGNESSLTSEVSDTPAAASGVSISGGANIQTTVNANGAGTTYLLAAGNYSGQTVSPKDGDTFIGAAGAIMNGNNNTQYAFTPGNANDVTIRNLEIKNYAPSDLQHAPVTARTHEGAAKGLRWKVENCSLHHNRGAGLHLSDGGIARNNKIFSNGVIGLKMYWIRNLGGLVEGNEIYDNNPAGLGDPFWEAGGTKFAWCKDLVVRNNHAHDNDGPGLWTDIDNVNTLYEGNLIEDNSGVGLFHEISYSAIIRNNVVTGNGWRNRGWFWEAGIMIAACQNVEVYGNTVSGNFNGITLIEQNRGAGAFGTYVVGNVFVHDNTVTDGRVGAVQETGNNAIFTSRNNRFENNDYDGTTFHWLGAQRTFAQWQGYGHDDTGSYVA